MCEFAERLDGLPPSGHWMTRKPFSEANWAPSWLRTASSLHELGTFDPGEGVPGTGQECGPRRRDRCVRPSEIDWW